jgi:hypothetical protein
VQIQPPDGLCNGNIDATCAAGRFRGKILITAPNRRKRKWLGLLDKQRKLIVEGSKDEPPFLSDQASAFSSSLYRVESLARNRQRSGTRARGVQSGLPLLSAPRRQEKSSRFGVQPFIECVAIEATLILEHIRPDLDKY